MFTGLIEDTGRVTAFSRRGEAGLLTVETAIPMAEIALGDSIAVNGACLTVTEKGNRNATFDVSPESIARTTIGNLRSGSRVNLERALKMGDRLGGHIVSGHIDCCGRLTRIESRSGNHQLYFSLPVSTLPISGRKRLRNHRRHQPDGQLCFTGWLLGEYHSAHVRKNDAGADPER